MKIKSISTLGFALLLGILLIAATLRFRPAVPIDETRYISIAWEMWQRGDLLVPHLNGAPYSQKPPLLFWLIEASWKLLGVNQWSARLINPLFGLVNLFLISRLARLLWPGEEKVARLAPLILVGTLLWDAYSATAMFDMMLITFILLSALGMLLHRRGRLSWILMSIGIGGGMLTKGPVALVYILPPALLAPWWMKGEAHPRWPRWYLDLLLVLFLGTIIVLAWAVPAALAGGRQYARSIFWKQEAGRMVRAFAHQRPWWWYLPFLPFLIFPWILWKPLWRGWSGLRREWGGRFCAALIVPAFFILSLFSGKQAHYLLPLIPFFSLLTARALASHPGPPPRRATAGIALFVALFGLALLVVPYISGPLKYPEMRRIAPWGTLPLLALGAWLWFRRPVDLISGARGISAAMAALLIIPLINFSPAVSARFDARPLSLKLARLQSEGRPILHCGKYDGQFQFPGRLREPLKVLRRRSEIIAWARHHPRGYLVIRYAIGSKVTESGAIHVQNYNQKRLALWPVQALLSRPEIWNKL